MYHIRVVYFFFFFITIQVMAQEVIVKGLVLDEEQRPLVYANVGVLHKDIGTVTNAQGEFSIYLDATLHKEDTLKISFLGHQPYKIGLKSLQKEQLNTIVLSKEIETLETVILRPKNTKTYTTGNEKINTSRAVNFAITNKKNQNLGAAIGRKFKLKNKKPSELTAFSFYINKNTFEEITFRINIYALEGDKPLKKINKSNILTKANKNQKGWIDVDLTPYEIITHGNVMIAVEWVDYKGEQRSKLSLPIKIPSLFATHYYKFGSQSKWKKYKNISSAMKLTYEN
ncbi:carboxypeptidase-like regulatory domain-containing protein [Aquimarina rhabdastrellae]